MLAKEKQKPIPDEDLEDWDVADEEVTTKDLKSKKEPVTDEDAFDDFEIEPAGKPGKPGKPGELDIEPEAPAKGKLPVEPEADAEPVLEPEKIDTEHAFEPQLVKLEIRSEKCGICLGAIKTGLMAIKCKCGKYYHDTCGKRVGECPSCDRKFDLDKIKETAERMQKEAEEEDYAMLEGLEEFDEKPAEAELPKKGAVKEKDKDKSSPDKVADILSGLEERLAKGEISEDTYLALKKKYEKI